MIDVATSKGFGAKYRSLIKGITQASVMINRVTCGFCVRIATIGLNHEFTGLFQTLAKGHFYLLTLNPKNLLLEIFNNNYANQRLERHWRLHSS